MSTSTRPDDRTSRVHPPRGALTRWCLIGGPLLLLTADLVDSHPASTSGLQAIAAHPGRHGAWIVLGLVACLLLGTAVSRLAAGLRDQHRVVALLGGTLAGLGVVALAAQRGLHIALEQLATVGGSAGAEVTRRIDASALVAVLLVAAILGTWLGQLLLAVAAWRSQATVVWVPAILVLVLVVSVVSKTPVPSDVVSLLGLGWLGTTWAQWRRTASQVDAPDAALR
jgi:hypothetical protein